MHKRTTHRSRKGKKLYAVRTKTGKFKDIQTYERAHRTDLRKRRTKSDRFQPGKTVYVKVKLTRKLSYGDLWMIKLGKVPLVMPQEEMRLK